MGDTGLEQSALTPSKTLISQNERAKSGASDDKIVQKYPELRELVKVWPELPGHIKASIKALIQTQKKGD